MPVCALQSGAAYRCVAAVNSQTAIGGVSACLFSSSAKIRGLGVFGIVSTNFPLEAARSFSCSTYALQASVRPSRSYSHQDDHDRDAKDGQTGESSHHQPMALTGVVTRTVDR